MLKYTLVHPQMLEALSQSGHTSRILIADCNYPAATRIGPHAAQVNLNLSPGIVTCTEVLHAVAGAIPLEAACVMHDPKERYPLDHEPPVWSEFRTIFRANGLAMELESLTPECFYELASGPDVALAVITADQRLFASLLLTVGMSL